MHTQKRLRLLHSIAPTPLATADALLPSAWHCAPRPYTRAHVLPSAWHCAPRPCKRRRLSVFCLSLRTSAHTGAAIRFPAAIPGKSVVLRANSQLFRIRREELLFGLCCRRSYGLPRRFAPRNDMLKTATRLRLQGTGAIRAPRQKRGTLHPSPAVRTLTKLVIASQCAHWCGNPFSPQGNLASRYYFGQIRMHFPVFALGAAFCFVLPQENGLSRRFAPRNDRQKFAGYPRLPGGTAGALPVCPVLSGPPRLTAAMVPGRLPAVPRYCTNTPQASQPTVGIRRKKTPEQSELCSGAW